MIPDVGAPGHIDRVGTDGEPKRRRPPRAGLSPLAFIGPFMIVFLAVYLAPVGYAVYLSLFSTRSSGLGYGAPTTKYSGLGNYRAALSDQDYRSSLIRVVLIIVVLVPLLIVLAGVMALLIDATGRSLRSVFRTVYFLPYAVPGVIGTILWSFLYLPGVSPIVAGLRHLNITVDFLSSHNVLWSLLNVMTWEFAGYNMLIIYAALLSVPQDTVEAARIDGANEVQVALRIKLPQIIPAVVVAAIFTLIGTMQIFAEPLLLRTIAPAINAHYTPNLSAYTEAFTNNNYNLAAAEAVIIAAAAFFVSFGLMRVARHGVFAR